MQCIVKIVGGVKMVCHYLDDILIIAVTAAECKQDLEVACALLEAMGFPVNYKKVTRTPEQREVYLGLEIDTVARLVRIPAVRLARIQQLVEKWQRRRTATKRQAQVIVGILNYCARGIKGGRAHLRRMHDAIHYQVADSETEDERNARYKQWQEQESELGRAEQLLALGDEQLGAKDQEEEADAAHIVTLDEGWQLDMAFWKYVLNLPEFSQGTDLMYFASPVGTGLQRTLKCDASLSWGWGCTFKKEWVSEPWEADIAGEEMAYKELYGIVRSVYHYAPELAGQQYLVGCNSTDVVMKVRKGSTKNEKLMTLIRLLHVIMVKYACYIWLEVVPQQDNAGPYHLSHGRIHEFQHEFTDVNPTATVPCPLPTYQELAVPSREGGRSPS